jgi:hypothetical protein
MSDYTIAAIPTLYRGRQYRSRLEARWAAFFDLLGWNAEYEPFDLGKWSPDFMLASSPNALGPLVEVKPEITRADFDRMVSACRERNMLPRVRAVILVGSAPVLCRIKGQLKVLIGEMSYEPEAGTGSLVAAICWLPAPNRPGLRADVASICGTDPDHCQPCGLLSRTPIGCHFEAVLYYPEYVMDLWARATNAVQYQREDRP